MAQHESIHNQKPPNKTAGGPYAAGPPADRHMDTSDQLTLASESAISFCSDCPDCCLVSCSPDPQATIHGKRAPADLATLSGACERNFTRSLPCRIRKLQQTTNKQDLDELSFVLRARYANGEHPNEQQSRHISSRGRKGCMFVGILSGIMASLSFCTGLVFVKLLPIYTGFKEDPTSFKVQTQLVLFRGLVLMLGPSLTSLLRGTSLLTPRSDIPYNLMRCFFGTAVVLGSYCSVKYISLADSTALVFLAPIWTSLLGRFVFKEPLGWLHVFALPASLIGVVLISHPSLIVDELDSMAEVASPQLLPSDLSSNLTAAAALSVSSLNVSQVSLASGSDLESDDDFEHRLPGIVIALATSLLTALSYISLKLCKNTPIQATVFWLGVSNAGTALAVMCFVGTGRWPDDLVGWLLLVGNGLMSWSAQAFLQHALDNEEAGILSIVRTIDVPITFVLTALIFRQDKIYWTSVAGSAIIIFVVVVILLNTLRRRRATDQLAQNEQRNTPAASLDHSVSVASQPLPMSNQKTMSLALLPGQKGSRVGTCQLAA